MRSAFIHGDAKKSQGTAAISKPNVSSAPGRIDRGRDPRRMTTRSHVTVETATAPPDFHYITPPASKCEFQKFSLTLLTGNLTLISLHTAAQRPCPSLALFQCSDHCSTTSRARLSHYAPLIVLYASPSGLCNQLVPVAYRQSPPNHHSDPSHPSHSSPPVSPSITLSLFTQSLKPTC